MTAPQQPESTPEPDEPQQPQEPQETAETGTAGEEDVRRSLEETVAELEDRWRRALADLDNARKRSVREVQRERVAERARVAAAFLPIVDNLEMALRHAEADPGSIVQGVRAVRDQAVRLLSDLGYPRDEDVGEQFDPRRHEVVEVVEEPEAEPGTVVQVLRPGYGAVGQQLRPAAVAVARGQE